jgi:hypothetical protein
MFAKKHPTIQAKVSNPIISNDVLIRFIMDHHCPVTVGVVTSSAFQTAQLKTGLSVSIDRLLDQHTRCLLINNLQGNKSKYIKDCSAIVKDIEDIKDVSGNNVFDIIYSPVQGHAPLQIIANPAHADIIFSKYTQSVSKSLHKSYQSKLMKSFNV